MSIISVSRLDECDDIYSLFGNGKNVTFRLNDKGALMDNTLQTQNVIFTGIKRADRLYYLDSLCQKTEVANAITTKNPSRLEQAHRLFGHLNYDSLRSLTRKNMVIGLKLSMEDLRVIPPTCPACAMGKMTRASFPLSESSRVSEFLSLVHSDLWGPAPVQTASGSHYMMMLLDDFSCWTWVFFLRRKSDTFSAFQEWKSQIEKSLNRSLTIF